jgi:hypothetical protein
MLVAQVSNLLAMESAVVSARSAGLPNEIRRYSRARLKHYPKIAKAVARAEGIC